ncbi:hypothetical protein LIER_42541 [Lithospermum erythrorhizon]|uniref:RNase H type-1 domain-containing protein n=1 Tax=Lithospermum erythrorhizon TaxID=34254 RepID=A0AAV3NJA8_LITER
MELNCQVISSGPFKETIQKAVQQTKAFRHDEGATCVIGRDLTGSFVGTRYKLLQWVTSPLVAEAHALREGLHLAWELNCRRVELESDSKQLINMLNGEQRTSMEVETLVGDILFLAIHMNVKFQYVKRSINNPAYEVAYWDHGRTIEAEWLMMRAPDLACISPLS